jgi:hypothetical protein
VDDGKPVDTPSWEAIRRLVRGLLPSALFKEKWAETPYTDTQVPTYNADTGKFEPGTVGNGLGAPTAADYLVGTANATLSAEIVVGTTPGGELGGTWGSPTVDATHSGSAHHAAVTVSGTPDYITLSGQDIVRGSVDLAADVTGTLPIANGGTGQTTAQAAIDALTTAKIAFSGTQTDTLAATENNYDPGTTAVLLLTGALPLSSITGISGGAAGRILTIHNVGSSYSIFLTHEGAGSTAGNRFALPESAAVVITSGESVTLQYDGGASRWRLIHTYLAKAHGASIHTGDAWRMTYQDSNGDDTEFTLGADGTFLESNGASAAPAFRALVGTDVPAGDTSGRGTLEVATAAETTTGTDAGRAVSPDGLAGSDYGKRVVGVLVSDPGGDAITTGNGKAYFRIPSVMNGWNLVNCDASLVTKSSSGAVSIMIRRNRWTTNATTARTDADMLSTAITIDANEWDSDDATASAINGANDDVITGDQIHVDIDGAGTGAKGLFVELTFQLP